MKPQEKRIYLIQPTYRNPNGDLFKGRKLSYCSLALPALSATIPDDWEKTFCIEYYNDVDYDSPASVVGISSMGYDLLHGIEIAREFRKRGKTVIFGGSQASFSIERLRTICDIIVHGSPGRREMQTILNDICTGQHLAEYQGGLHVNFPFDYSVLKGKEMQFMPVLTSIGCRNNCDFCCTATLCKGQYRLRNIECVLTDLHVVRKRGRDIVFGDANIFNNREYLARLCLRIVEEDLNIRWGAQCTIDIGDDPVLLRLLKESGCIMLLVGLETLNQENLTGFDKYYAVSRHRERIARIRDAGIEVGGYFMLGLDGDTVDTFETLFDFIHDNRIALPILNLLLPAPGTKASERLKNEGRLLIQNEEEFLKNNARYATACSHCFYLPKLMSVDEAETGFLRLYRRLTSYREIMRRSMRINPLTAATLFLFNLEMRTDYQAMLELHHHHSNHPQRASNGTYA
ncbi:MAG: B12-binding domain-containing radical SAM protein [bacterium]